MRSNSIGNKKSTLCTQSYLRAWESPVSSIQEPDKIFNGVYRFDKNCIGCGDGKNTASILSSYHTYTVGYEHNFSFQHMPKVQDDFAVKIRKVLDTHDTIAFYNGIKLEEDYQLLEDMRLANLEKWDFRKKSNPEKLARKKAMISNITNIHSYVLEDAFSQLLETRWPEVRDRLLNEIERKTQNKLVQNTDVVVPLEYAEQVVHMMILTMCRNPQFDSLDAFTVADNLLDMLLCDNDGKLSQDALTMKNNQMTSAWFSQMYKGLFGDGKGFCNLYKKKFQKRCNLFLLRCSEKHSDFVTSDNPAFHYNSNALNKNRTGFYFPLTPKYVLAIGQGAPHTMNKVNIRSIQHHEVQLLNQIIVSQAKHSVISNKKYLGYIL